MPLDRRSVALLPAAALLLGGCPEVEPTFSDIREKIFERSCTDASQCHRMADARGGLDLETDPYGALVNVEAMGDPDEMPPVTPIGRIRVIPGDPEGSYLMDKIEGTLAPNEGERMPNAPGLRLRRYEIDAVREWIAAGAAND